VNKFSKKKKNYSQCDFIIFIFIKTDLTRRLLVVFSLKRTLKPLTICIQLYSIFISQIKKLLCLLSYIVWLCCIFYIVPQVQLDLLRCPSKKNWYKNLKQNILLLLLCIASRNGMETSWKKSLVTSLKMNVQRYYYY
jgi:hypothetical protein